MSLKIRFTPKALVLAAVVMTVCGSPALAQRRLALPAPTAPIVPAETDWRTVAPENLLVVDTTKGRVLVEMEPRVAPLAVERIRTLADRGFYDGLKWHRVITGFMAQGGDPLGTGQGGSDLPDVKGEFAFRRERTPDFAVVPQSGDGVRGILGSMPIVTQPDAQMFVTADMKTAAGGLFCPGVAGMARATSVDSANSQFYLMTGTNANLNGLYTTFGRVVSGLDVVKALKTGQGSDGAVTDPDLMTRVRTADAMPASERPSVRVLNPNSPAFVQRYETLRNARGLNFSICDVEIPVEVTGGVAPTGQVSAVPASGS